MIKEKCDVCGKEFSDRYNLTTLYDGYQSKEIKEVCKDCYAEIVQASGKIDEALKPVKQGWIKKIIMGMVK